ncbi:hypothetical protein TNCV_636711 [Trichonephila clavipes]|nr:hypothetical protein TNCV_636711 [Trichonephila clavipes]
MIGNRCKLRNSMKGFRYCRSKRLLELSKIIQPETSHILRSQIVGARPTEVSVTEASQLLGVSRGFEPQVMTAYTQHCKKKARQSIIVDGRSLVEETDGMGERLEDTCSIVCDHNCLLTNVKHGGESVMIRSAISWFSAEPIVVLKGRGSLGSSTEKF